MAAWILPSALITDRVVRFGRQPNNSHLHIPRPAKYRTAARLCQALKTQRKDSSSTLPQLCKLANKQATNGGRGKTKKRKKEKRWPSETGREKSTEYLAHHPPPKTHSAPLLLHGQGGSGRGPAGGAPPAALGGSPGTPGAPPVRSSPAAGPNGKAPPRPGPRAPHRGRPLAPPAPGAAPAPRPPAGPERQSLALAIAASTLPPARPPQVPAASRPRGHTRARALLTRAGPAAPEPPRPPS